MTTEKAIEFVKKRGLPYWKLYKGNKRVSQCDEDENPDGNIEIAFDLFLQELESRSAGNYEVNVYKKIKGESGGFKFEFAINQSNQNTMNPGAMMTLDQVRQTIQNEMEIKNSLASLHDKVNAIGEFLYRQHNEEERDDFSGILKLAEAFKGFRGLAAQPTAFDTTARPLSKGVSAGFFS